MKVSRKIVVLFVVVAMLMTFAGCTVVGTQKRPPQWLSTLYDKQYSAEEYLCSVGSGTTKEEASEAALAALSQVFHVQVRSASTLISYHGKSTDGEGNMLFSDRSDLFEQGTILSQSEKILGSEVVNTYHREDGVVFVRLALNREQAATRALQEIQELENSLQKIRIASRRLAHPLEQYLSLTKAMELAKRQQNLADQVFVLRGSSVNSSLATLQNELTVLGRLVKVAVVVHADEGKESLAHAFSQKLLEQGFQVVTVDSEAPARLEIRYEASPLNLAQSPYQFEKYSLSAMLTVDGRTLLAFQASDREAALSREDASRKALTKASTVVVHEFFTLLQQQGEDTLQ